MKIQVEQTRIYVRPGATDLRKGVTGLAQIIMNEMKLNALSGSIFMFCNKSHKLIKVLFWDKTGFWVAQKKLEQATWPWPSDVKKVREINEEQLLMLLAGIDFWRAHQELHFTEMC